MVTVVLPCGSVDINNYSQQQATVHVYSGCNNREDFDFDD